MRRENVVVVQILSDSRSLPVVRGAVEQMAASEGLKPADSHGLILAIDEALANVIKHGYGGQTDQPITITLSSVEADDGRRGIAIEVRDRARQVDPGSICGRNLDDVRPGGLGVHIIRAVMDEAEYSCPEEGGMCLRMVKYVSNASQRDAGDEASESQQPMQ
ncbi:MAG TPA: ATP-binding protein [Phycisphaerae bacterium]|nr:ATP-binding protein [Phycisphaerae bacterium]